MTKNSVLSIYLTLFVALLACSVGSVNAATIENISGVVMVNKGNGFKKVSTSQQVGTGDSVLAQSGGSARIVYANGCSITVEPGNVQPVVPEDLCILGNSSSAGLLSTEVVVGGLVVAGGVAAAIVLSNSGNDKRASP